MSPRKQKQKSHGSGRGICSADWYTLASKMHDPSSMMIASSVVVGSGSSVTAATVETSSFGSSVSSVAGSGVVTSGVVVVSAAGFVGSVTAPTVTVASGGFVVSSSGLDVVGVTVEGAEGVVAFSSGACVVGVLPVKNSMMVVNIDGASVVVAGGTAFLPSTGSTVVVAA